MTQIHTRVKSPQEKTKPPRMRALMVKRWLSRKSPKKPQAMVPVMAERKDARARARTEK